MLQDFKNFLMRGNVVDLAVAVVIGAAFKTVVDAFVANILNPIVAAIFGKPDLSGVLTFTLREGSSEVDAEGVLVDPDTILSIGAVLDAFLNFAIVGAALFIVVKSYEKLQERRASDEEEEEVDAPSDEVILLTEIRDSLRSRQA